MIRLYTKGQYGTRLMLNLAQHYGTGSRIAILKDVSADEEISIRYLEQIITPLRVSRLVKSIRGAGGGYTLARNPEEIRLDEILYALEGTCCLVECVEDEDYCDRIETCATFDIWKGASMILKDYFHNISLRDILKMAEKKKSAKGQTKAKAC
jgi:Rrf2 family cysteine metabolism transcriptional repressor